MSGGGLQRGGAPPTPFRLTAADASHAVLRTPRPLRTFRRVGKVE